MRLSFHGFGTLVFAFGGVLMELKVIVNGAAVVTPIMPSARIRFIGITGEEGSATATKQSEHTQATEERDGGLRDIGDIEANPGDSGGAVLIPSCRW